MLFVKNDGALAVDVQHCDHCGYDHQHVYMYRVGGYGNVFRGSCPSTGHDLICVLTSPFAAPKP